MSVIKVTVDNCRTEKAYHYIAEADALPCMVLERAMLHIAEIEDLSPHNTELHIVKSKKEGEADRIELDNLLSIPLLGADDTNETGLASDDWCLVSVNGGKELTVRKRQKAWLKAWLDWGDSDWSSIAQIKGEVVEYEKKYWFI